MMRAEAWQDANSRYFSAALLWLRLAVLESDAREPEPEAAVAGKGARRQPGSSHGDRLSAAAAKMLAVEAEMQPPPALRLLTESLGLSEFERNVLLLAIGCELDGSLCGPAGGARLEPTFARAMQVFGDPAWDAMSPDRPLRYWRLVALQAGELPGLLHSRLHPDERVVNFCRGLNHLDERLAAYVSELPARIIGLPLPASQRRAAEAVIAGASSGEAGVIQLLGRDSLSQQMVALAAAQALGRRLYRMGSDSMPSAPGEIAVFARLWGRESQLMPIALYVDAQELDGNEGDVHASVRRLLAALDGCVMLATREPWQRIAGPVCSVRVSKPTGEEQADLWRSQLTELGAEGAQASGAAEALVGQFDLNAAEICEIAAAATGAATRTETPIEPVLWEMCREHAQPRLDQLAQRLDPRADWNDLVLPRAELELLRQVAAQVSQRATVYGDWGFGERMNRGLGISALFAGESGTGKTMAAEVLANALRLGLYRIDLSAVVSKYIGETEKNLRRLFDAAEDGGTILFFDEADALFGKRSEVRDSHDRYANIEVNYLLQRMESFRGLAILATNMRSSLDAAFTRRLRFVVTFPFPGISDRRLMWQKAFPAKTPTRDLDFGRLARLNLTGGNIHSAAINAAFLAADRGSPVTMAEALMAARNELLKLDQPVMESDFLWLEPKGAA